MNDGSTTSTVSAVAASPNTATPKPSALVPLPFGARTKTSAPTTATVSPRSSLTRTSGSAHSTAATGRPRPSAVAAKANSGTANAISWKSSATASTIPQEAPVRPPTSTANLGPPTSKAHRASGTTANAISTACASSSVTALGNSRYSGARVASSGWKWSPSSW